MQETLELFVLFRPDLEYVQGMVYPAMLLFIHLEPYSQFLSFANMVVSNPLLVALYTFHPWKMEAYFGVFTQILAREMPKVARHLSTHGLESKTYLVEWLYTVFGRSLPLASVLSLWDLLLQNDYSVLFKACLVLVESVSSALLVANYENTLGIIRSSGTSIDTRIFSSRLYDPKVFSRVTVKNIEKLLVQYKHV